LQPFIPPETAGVWGLLWGCYFVMERKAVALARAIRSRLGFQESGRR
jgi:hypothetical protein